jgi:hypothetical protein
MSARSIRLTAASTFAGLAATALVATASPASAYALQSKLLQPGDSVCVSQYAGYQVRGDGTATGDGARFKILRGVSVASATPGRATGWAQELRSSYGTFPGRDYYSACAYNTGTTATRVTISIKTDGEL